METKLGLVRRDFKHNNENTFRYFYEDINFSDVTLVSKDHKHIKAHKAMLSAGSQFFHEVFLRSPHPHPLVYLQVSSEELVSLVSFLYLGECQVRPQDIDQFLETARGLRIEGIVSEKDDTHHSVKSPLSVDNYNILNYKSTTLNLKEPLKKKGVSDTNTSKPFLLKENINYGQNTEENEYEANCENPTDIIAQGTRYEDNEFLEEIMECLPATQAISKDECALKETEKVPQLAISGSPPQRCQDDPATSKILSLTVRVLTKDGCQSDIKDVATARVLLNRHLRPSPPPPLPAPLSEIAMDTNKVVAVLRTQWKHEGYAWGNNSSYYDFMNVSIPIESFSPQTKNMLRNEKNTTVKLSDVIKIMEEPSLKPRLSKKYINQSKREIHVMIIEALLKINKRDPENYYVRKRL